MDLVKEAFQHIKYDILDLKKEISELRNQIQQLKQTQKYPTTPTVPTQTPTQNPVPTDKQTHIPTQVQAKTPKKEQFTHDLQYTSTGNGGVPTDKQTNRQTDKQTDNHDKFDDFQKATKVLDSLDSIKKGIRLKFKRLTSQEMLVFSTLYGLEGQNIEEITYKIIANNLKLSESSIRDYTNKLMSKGIPIIKIRLNNKKIILKISPDLKKIASLSSIINLREL